MLSQPSTPVSGGEESLSVLALRLRVIDKTAAPGSIRWPLVVPGGQPRSMGAGLGSPLSSGLRQPFSLLSLPHVPESAHIGKQSGPHCRTALLFTGQRMGTGLSHDLQRRLTTEPCLPAEGCLVVARVDPAACSTSLSPHPRLYPQLMTETP